MRVLFVCYGNLCRSPMAEGICRELIRRGYPGFAGAVEVSSAGVGGLLGTPATREAVDVMGARGIDISGHRARALTPDIASSADLVLTMDEEQREEAEALVRGRATAVFLLSKFAEASRAFIEKAGATPPGEGLGDLNARLGRIVDAASGTERRKAGAGPPEGYEVEDPMGKPIDNYVRVADTIGRHIETILEALLGGTVSSRAC